MLVFSEKKAEVDDIHEYLLLKGVEAVAIHGGKGAYVCTCDAFLYSTCGTMFANGVIICYFACIQSNPPKAIT